MKSVQGLMTNFLNKKKTNRNNQSLAKEGRQKTQETFSPSLKWTWTRQ